MNVNSIKDLKPVSIRASKQVLSTDRKLFGRGAVRTKTTVVWFAVDTSGYMKRHTKCVISIFRTYDVRYLLGIPVGRSIVTSVCDEEI